MKDAARHLTAAEISAAAISIEVEPAVIFALREVETAGRGAFLPDRRPTILFEGHIFWRELARRGIDPKKHTRGNESILYEHWTKEHYRGGAAEYQRLGRATAIHADAARASASWGMFQIMGFNYEACGCQSISDFVAKMSECEAAQLELWLKFVTRRGLLPYLRTHDWKSFAQRYNGAGYAANRYDTRLRDAFHRHAGKATSLNGLQG